MEMEMAAAAAMDFHALSRRELQALCKRNGVRANMTNAAMAVALQGLDSVDGIDEIGTTLCLPTPGRSAMKSAAKVGEMAGEEQHHGSPLPRGRRVSVKSPEAIRMEVEEGEDEVKRDLGKDIVRTPGVALRSSSRRARATPAPLPPTPVPASSARTTARRAAVRKTEEVAPTPATLRRSQRSSVRKGAAPVVVDISGDDASVAKRTTRSARSKVTIALEQEDEMAAAAPKEEKAVLEEPKAMASDVKCDGPEEEEVTKLLEGNNKEEEPEEGDEADSSDAKIGSAAILDKSCHDPQVEEVAVVLEASTKPHEGILEEKEASTKPHEGILEEKEPTSVEKPASLTVMEDSPILGLLSKVETEGPAVEKEHVSSVEDGQGLAEWSPEMTDEIIPDIEDKEVAVDEEAVKEAVFAVTGDTNPTTEEILPIAVEVETSEDDGLTDEMSQTEFPDDQTNEEVDEDDHFAVPAHEVPQAELANDETSEEDDNTELKESAAVKMEQVELIEEDISEEEDHTELKDGHSVKMPPAELIEEGIMKEDDLDEEEEWASEDDNDFDEIGSSDESDEETETSEQSYTGDVDQMPQGTEEDNEDASAEDDDFSGDLPSESDEETETSEQSYTGDVAQMPQGTEEDNEDASAEDDDFSGDLPSEFDNIKIYSDDETESDIAPPVLDENQAAVMSLDDSSTNVEQQQEVPEEADATEKELKEVDYIVKSLDEFNFKEEEAKEITKQPRPENLEGMSLRKLKTELKNRLIALKETKEEVTEGKRLPLEEVDGNAGVDF